jgi:hypothetical protein
VLTSSISRGRDCGLASHWALIHELMSRGVEIASSDGLLLSC